MPRPRSPSDKVAAALALMDEGHSAEEAAQKVGGVSMRTLYRRKGEMEQEKAKPSEKPDVGGNLELARLILQTRNPGALEDLEKGLAKAREGAEALREWLAQPLPRTEPMDPYDAAALALAAAAAAVERLPAQSPRTATVISALATVANTCEKIMRGRPREVTPDEVETRIADRAKEARERIVQHTREAGKLLAARRAALKTWLREEVAPRVYAEYERLEAEMLGAP